MHFGHSAWIDFCKVMNEQCCLFCIKLSLLVATHCNSCQCKSFVFQLCWDLLSTNFTRDTNKEVKLSRHSFYENKRNQFITTNPWILETFWCMAHINIFKLKLAVKVSNFLVRLNCTYLRFQWLVMLWTLFHIQQFVQYNCSAKNGTKGTRVHFYRERDRGNAA